MKRFAKWLLLGLLVLMLLLGGGALALQRWLASQDFSQRVSQQVSAALGLPVQLGAIAIDVWPVPAVALDQVRIESRPPLVLERVEARPVWVGLIRGHLEVATLVVRHAVVPERAVAAIAAAVQKSRAAADARPLGRTASSVSILPRRALLEDVTWVPAKGGSTTLDAQFALDGDGWPAVGQMKVLKGRFEGAHASLQREADHWTLHAELGGGTVTGRLQLQPAGKAGWRLQGQFDTHGVEVAALTAPSRTLTGQLEAHTTLQSEFQEPGMLAEALQSQTRFTVRNAVVHGIDLAQAVKTVGLSRGGETRLDTLAGSVATQGHTVHLHNLVATSGMLSANGNVTMAPNRGLNGRISVELAKAASGGSIGVPLAVGGTLDSPTVQLTRSALVGAAIGTALAPGVGTGAGAALGDKLGQGLRGIFGK